MSRISRRYAKVHPKNPRGLGVCDYSGFVFNHKDLVKQKEWRGDNLVWTGFLVGKPFTDKPQQQNRPPIVKADPKPIKDARLPDYDTNSESNPSLPWEELINKLNNFHWGS